MSITETMQTAMLKTDRENMRRNIINLLKMEGESFCPHSVAGVG
jgi:hypothetical protein